MTDLISAKAIATAALAAREAGTLCAKVGDETFYYVSDRPGISCAVGIGLTVEQRQNSQEHISYEIDQQIEAGLYRVANPAETQQLAHLQYLHDVWSSDRDTLAEDVFVAYAKELAGV